MKNYFIKDSYTCRINNAFFDDTSNTDSWQKEVYLYAKKIFTDFNFTSVIDVGAGSGYKLMQNFKDANTIGIDLPQTVGWLRNKYPDRIWIDSLNPIKNYDLVIASDIIEHLVDPDILLDFIYNSQPKLAIVSTPDRNLLSSAFHNGPPNNRSHVREWTMKEMYDYINSRFEVKEHLISNKRQATQVILFSI